MRHHSPSTPVPATSSTSRSSTTTGRRSLLPALPDPWRSYNTSPVPSLSSVAAVGGVAGPPQRVEDRSDRRKPVASDPAAAPAPAEGPGPGLVLCAISGRQATNTAPDLDDETSTAEVPDTVRGLWSPRFPSPEMVDAAAALLPAVVEEPGTLAEGPRWELTVGPGMFAVACRDWSKYERTGERQRQGRVKDVDAAVAAFVATGEWPDPPTPRTAINSWSRKSRANMVRRLCELDYTPLYDGGRLPAMVTLTYPGDWLTVAPTGGYVKRHMKALRKRYQRAWGEDWSAVWKLEFQRRGAPHVHLLCTPPHGHAQTTGQTFAVWLSAAWAAVVNHPDPEQRRRHERAGTGLDYAEGLRATDPRRVAAYFTKHGLMASKEYQHHVPAEWSEPGTGPGRFWGVWNLQRATRTVQVTPADGIRAGRTARRWARAQGRVQSRWVQRVDQATGRVRYRRSRTRVRLMTNGNRGWIATNCGPAWVSDLARALTGLRE